MTDKRFDYCEFKKWAPTAPLAAKDTGYGVVEIYLDANGQGTGTLSLVADVKVDAANADVSLAGGVPKVPGSARATLHGFTESNGDDTWFPFLRALRPT